MTSDGVSAPLIVVVAYQSDDHLEACLTPLTRTFSVVVIDNEAAPSTERIVAALGARYVATPHNLGFGRAVNLAISTVWDGHSDILLLNPDARVSAEDVHKLQRALHAEARRAAVGPKLIGDDGQLQRADWPLPSPGQVWFDALALSRLWRGPRFVTGAVLMLSGAAVAELGGFDERYFLYAEEADWQMAARRAGWSVAVVPEITAHHVGAASSSDPMLRLRLFVSSGALFGRKWYSQAGWLVMKCGSVVAAVRRSLIGSIESRQTARRTLTLLLSREQPVSNGRAA